MASEIRQFENAVNLLVNGVLRDVGPEHDESENEMLEGLVEGLRRTASQWGENLANPGLEPTVDGMSVELIHKGMELNRSPVNLETAILSLAQEYADLQGDANAKKMLIGTASLLNQE